MRIVTLREIRLINQGSLFPDWQKRVETWMTQWTIQNNYPQYVVEDEFAVGTALLGWKRLLLDSVNGHFKSLIPEWAKEAFDPAMAFEFSFILSQEVAVGGTFNSSEGTKLAVDLFRVDDYLNQLATRQLREATFNMQKQPE